MPAIILHGSFDFSLFAMGSISFLYSDYDLVVTIVGIILVGSMTVGGAVYAYKSYKKVNHLIILYHVMLSFMIATFANFMQEDTLTHFILFQVILYYFISLFFISAV